MCLEGVKSGVWEVSGTPFPEVLRGSGDSQGVRGGEGGGQNPSKVPCGTQGGTQAPESAPDCLFLKTHNPLNLNGL